MRARKAVVLATALPLLIGGAGGCGSSTGSLGPLGGPANGGGICFRFHPGQTFTDSEIVHVNTSHAPVTITRAWLTGLRDMTVDAVYADAFTAGAVNVPEVNADWYGWPPVSLRHPAPGVVVPAGKAVTVLFTVTGHGPAAFFAGQDIAYTSQGQSWTQANPRFLGPGPNC